MNVHSFVLLLICIPTYIVLMLIMNLLQRKIIIGLRPPVLARQSSAPVGAWIVLGCGWPSRTSSDHVWMVFPADPSGWVLMCRSGANPREWRAIPTSLDVKILESLDMLMTRKSWRSAENIWTSIQSCQATNLVTYRHII